MALALAILALFLLLCFCSALLRWNEVRYRRKGLPPGTMGWPFFGETTEFLKQGPNFMKSQRARYPFFFFLFFFFFGFLIIALFFFFL